MVRFLHQVLVSLPTNSCVKCAGECAAGLGDWSYPELERHSRAEPEEEERDGGLHFVYMKYRDKGYERRGPR